jgi:triosephosphate isomerase
VEKRLIVANWKDNKTFNEVIAWFDKVGPYSKNLSSVTVVVCPPAIYLPLAYQLITQNQYKLELGAQDVSQFDSGPFTGEISARQIAQFAKYVLIGHSERRRHLLETSDIILKKVEISIQFGLTPIICVDQYQKDELLSYIDKPVIVSYETPSAISSNPGASPEDPQKAAEICKTFKAIVKNAPVIYGGSVNPTTVKNYLSVPPISGVLASKATLDPDTFMSFIEASIF